MLRLIGSIVVMPYASFRLNSELLSKIFRYISSLSEAKSSGALRSSTKGNELQRSVQKGHAEFSAETLEEMISWDFSKPKLIKRKSFCAGKLGSSRYRYMMRRAHFVGLARSTI